MRVQARHGLVYFGELHHFASEIMLRITPISSTSAITSRDEVTDPPIEKPPTRPLRTLEIVSLSLAGMWTLINAASVPVSACGAMNQPGSIPCGRLPITGGRIVPTAPLVAS